MTIQPSDAYETLKKLRYDLTACQAKVSDLLKILNELNLPEAPAVHCDRCHFSFRSQTALEEHIYHAHGGPLPTTWARADALAGDVA